MIILFFVYIEIKRKDGIPLGFGTMASNKRHFTAICPSTAVIWVSLPVYS